VSALFRTYPQVRPYNGALLCSFSRCHNRAANSSGAPVQISDLPRGGGGKTFTTWVKEPLNPTSSAARFRSARPQTGMAAFLALSLALKTVPGAR